MSYLLWQLIRDVYQDLGGSEVAEVTGGTTTTLVDGNLAGQGRDDDYNEGLIMILQDAGGAGAAPEGEFKRVTDFVDSSGTFTFGAMTVAPASGDIYLRASPYYTMRNIIEQVNKGLVKLGELALVDTTTLDSANNQTEYAASVAWKRRGPFRVDIQTNTGDGNDNQWERVEEWEFIPAVPGTAGLIVLRKQPVAGRDLRVWYWSDHPRVSAYDDVIHESINPALAVSAVSVEALRWQIGRLSGSDKSLKEQINDAKLELERMRALYPIWKPPQRARMRSTGW